jgi:hypothetical protein
MEGDNAYFCEELGKRVPAVKRAAIKALPHMLCIHLKRFEFDYHNQTRYKVRRLLLSFVQRMPASKHTPERDGVCLGARNACREVQRQRVAVPAMHVHVVCLSYGAALLQQQLFLGVNYAAQVCNYYCCTHVCAFVCCPAL